MTLFEMVWYWRKPSNPMTQVTHGVRSLPVTFLRGVGGKKWFFGLMTYGDQRKRAMSEVTDEMVEAGARAIFEHWQFQGDKPEPIPWVVGGNSFKQDQARDYARTALTATLEAGDMMVPKP